MEGKKSKEKLNDMMWNMEIWVRVIFRLQSKVKEMIEANERRVSNLSISHSSSISTENLYEQLITLNDKKIRLINFNVLYELMARKLSKEQFDMMVFHSQKKLSMCELALLLDISKSAVNRKLTAIYRICIAVLRGMGYDDIKLDEEFGSVALIRRSVIHFRKLSEARKTAGETVKGEDNEQGKVIHCHSSEAFSACDCYL